MFDLVGVFYYNNTIPTTERELKHGILQPANEKRTC